MSTQHDRHAFGRELAQKLFEAEKALDRAIAASNELSAFMTRGRIDHEITAMLGQHALSGVAETGRGLVKARGRLLDAHEHLEKDARRINIHWRMAGPIEEKPKLTGEAPPLLKQVA